MVVLALVWLAGCSMDAAGNPAHCRSDSECAAGLRCYRNLCVGGGASDAGPSDAAPDRDTGATDAGDPRDAGGEVDAGDAPDAASCMMCGAGETCCLNRGTPTCVDTATDESHCGGCGRECIATLCMGGACL